MKHKNQTNGKCCPVEGHSIWETDNKVSQTAADWAWSNFTRLIKPWLRSEATLWRANATTTESTGHLETPSAPPSLCHSINLANFPELRGGGEMYTLTGLWPESGAGLRGFNLPSPFPPPPHSVRSLTPAPNEELHSKMRYLPFEKRKETQR